MPHRPSLQHLLAASSLAILIGCSGGEPPPETATPAATESAPSEQETEPAVEEPAEEVVEEESDGRLGLEETYEGMHRGARVRMSYDSETSSFKGVVENMMRDSMSDVLVTVELSNGSEITEKISHIEPGSRSNVELKVEAADFDRWSVSAAPGGEVAPPSQSEEPE